MRAARRGGNRDVPHAAQKRARVSQLPEPPVERVSVRRPTRPSERRGRACRRAALTALRTDDIRSNRYRAAAAATRRRSAWA